MTRIGVLASGVQHAMSAPQLAFLVVRMLSSSREFQISGTQARSVLPDTSKSREDETLRTTRKP
jgi:hypothetical protein